MTSVAPPLACRAHVVAHRLAVDDHVVIIDEYETNYVGACRIEDDSAGVSPGELGPTVGNGLDFHVEATVKMRGGRRCLYYSIDITVPWRGVIVRRGALPTHSHHDTFRGCVRLFNITHANKRSEWCENVGTQPTAPDH